MNVDLTRAAIVQAIDRCHLAFGTKGSRRLCRCSNDLLLRNAKFLQHFVQGVRHSCVLAAAGMEQRYYRYHWQIGSNNTSMLSRGSSSAASFPDSVIFYAGACTKRAAVAQRCIATGLPPLKKTIDHSSKSVIYRYGDNDLRLASAEKLVLELAVSSDQCRKQLVDAGFIHVGLPPSLPSLDLKTSAIQYRTWFDDAPDMSGRIRDTRDGWKVKCSFDPSVSFQQICASALEQLVLSVTGAAVALRAGGAQKDYYYAIGGALPCDKA